VSNKPISAVMSNSALLGWLERYYPLPAAGSSGGSGTPGGSNTQVQYNSAGTFAGSSNFTFDGTDVGVAAKIFHVGDTDTYINFTNDDINIQAGGVNFLDITQDTQNEITFNEAGVDIDFRVETADESHMLFIQGSSNRMSIGDSTNSPGATLEVTNHASAGATGVPLVQLNSNDTDQQCLDINAANVTANVVNITANDVTTARVLSIGADGLTTGNAFRVEDDSADTGTRNTALVVQNDAAAIAATALTIQSDGGKTGVKIDKNYSDLTEASIVGLDIDWDKTGASTSNNTMYGIQLDMDNTTATNGINYMYGLHVTPTLTHAANAGSTFVYGALIDAQGGTNGSSLVTGCRIAAQGGDFNYGLQLDVEDGANNVDLRIESSADNGDYFQIQTTTHGATTITTVDDNASAADLTFTVDGDISLDALAGAGTTTITSDLTVNGATILHSNAAAKLKVRDTTNDYQVTIAGEDTGPRIYFGDHDTGDDDYMTIGAFNSINNIDTEARDFHLFGTNTTTGFYFDESVGYFGMGTDEPQTPLHIAGGAGRLRLSDSNATTNQAVVAYTEYYKGENDARIAWVGFGSVSNENYVINNQTATGSFAVMTNNTTALVVDSSQNTILSGNLITPVQPGFSAYGSANQTITPNVWMQLSCSNEVFDNGSAYNTTTSYFTAPMTGKYLISTSIRIDDIDSGANQYVWCIIDTSNRDYYSALTGYDVDDDTSYYTLQANCIADMDANDTARIQFIVRLTAGAHTNTANSMGVRFQGWLLG